MSHGRERPCSLAFCGHFALQFTRCHTTAMSVSVSSIKCQIVICNEGWLAAVLGGGGEELLKVFFDQFLHVAVQYRFTSVLLLFSGFRTSRTSQHNRDSVGGRGFTCHRASSLEDIFSCREPGKLPHPWNQERCFKSVGSRITGVRWR